MKLVILILAATGLAAAQSATSLDLTSTKGATVFATGGATLQSAATGLFSFGVAKHVKSQDIFLDMSLGLNAAGGPTEIILVGVTQPLPFELTLKVLQKSVTFQPYAIAAFGSTLQQFPVLVGSLKATTGTTIALTSTNAAFSQAYGAAVKVASFNGIDLTVGAKVNKTLGAQAAPYPFLMVSKTF